MTKFLLLLGVESTKIASVRRPPNGRLLVQFRCTKCGEETKMISFSPDERIDIPNSRGTTNLHYTCKACSSRCNVEVTGEHVYDNQEALQKPILELEIRGSLEPITWSLVEFMAISTVGTEFIGDGSAKDWCDYDEALEEQVELISLTYTVK
ncbi:hypothetical protein GMRT_15228 [Giardia muris]|uniref:DUF866 domain-containing protein n=1 Tax=Giardia muris TaxID=5742 RepID=A0A4Z1SQM1_GIAMU|nr:hypothetical protein GMRT_15228 [Giardia muris]|eukprot:TNJ28152.1 hypothetical protein GMRT_15228 [Giardia muris]